MTRPKSRLTLWRDTPFLGVLGDVGNFALFALRRFINDGLSQAAGALTYSTLLALVPLLVIAFAVLSGFPAFDAVKVRMEELFLTALVPEVGTEVRTYLSDFTRNAGNLTAVGVVALGVTAVLLLWTIESTLNQIWRVERPRPLTMRLLIFWAILTLGPLLLGASFTLTNDALSTVQNWAPGAASVEAIQLTSKSLKNAIGILTQSVAFTLLFKLVPARHVRLRDAAIGGVFAGLAFQILRWGFNSFLTSGSTYATIYGAVAIFPIFLVWIYMSWTVIIIGAVLAASFPDWWLAGAALPLALGHCPRHHRHTLEWMDILRAEEPSERRMTKPSAKPNLVRKLRCAVYTRKSSEEGLEQEFNSLHAQREACEAYIASQRSEGWVLVRDQYDDGGISGGTLERPSLKRLQADIEDGLIDVVVVYKIDRLSRSLMDFSRLVEVFDRNGVTFVSVTQSFNTTTSMGRLTLNILLSFAQFEREVTGERIRDKIAASRKKGMWMGGVPPLGYEVRDRKLIIKEAEAAGVRWIFTRFIEIGSGTELARELDAREMRTRHGNRIDKKFLYRLLNNRAYIGEAVHKGESYPGEHDAIIDRQTWDKVHTILQESPRKRAARSRADTPALLKGLLFGPDGAAFSPTHTRKGSKLYRYYVSQTVLKHGAGSCPVGRVSAGEIEAAVIDQLRAVFRQPEIVAGTWKAARAHDGEIADADARDALTRLDPLWDELFPAEQARIVALLVERIDIGTEGLNVRLRVDGLRGLAREMQAGDTRDAA